MPHQYSSRLPAHIVLVSSDIDAIKQLLTTYHTAFFTPDIDDILALHSSEAIVILPSVSAPAEGEDAVRAAYTNALGATTPKATPRTPAPAPALL